jgi:hypothetical protein
MGVPDGADAGGGTGRFERDVSAGVCAPSDAKVAVAAVEGKRASQLDAVPAGCRSPNQPIHIYGSQPFVSSPCTWPVCNVPAISAEWRYGLITVADDDKMYC